MRSREHARVTTHGGKGRARHRRWALLAAFGLVAVAACDRPTYTFSDDVPLPGTSGTSFAGTGPVAGTSSGGMIPVETCGLDRIGSPALGSQAISNQTPIRDDSYVLLTDSELASFKQTGSLLGGAAAATPTPLGNMLNQLSLMASAAQKPLIAALAQRFKVTRSTWPNPWALRLLEHPASEHMNPVRISFKPNAWFVRILDGLPAVLDVNNAPVTLDAAVASPERIAAIYYVINDQTPGASVNCDSGRRELALGNEAMVESYSAGTPEILARWDADISALSALFRAVRPCSTFDSMGMTFHAYTVCTTWRYYDASSEAKAYQWALQNPMEIYKLTPQNLSDLVDALTADRFDPSPFSIQPPAYVPGVGGGGGVGGAPDAGASFGGAGSGAGGAAP